MLGEQLNLPIKLFDEAIWKYTKAGASEAKILAEMQSFEQF